MGPSLFFSSVSVNFCQPYFINTAILCQTMKTPTSFPGFFSPPPPPRGALPLGWGDEILWERRCKDSSLLLCDFSVLGGYSIAAYVLLTELVGIRHRSTAGCSIWYSFNFSSMSLAGLAYLVRDWRKLSIIMGAPAIPFVLGWL